MVQLVTNCLGSFALDSERGNIIEKILFDSKVEEIAKKLEKTEEGYCKEEEKLLQKLQETGNKIIEVESPKRFSGLKSKSNLELKFVEIDNHIPVSEIGSRIGVKSKEIEKLIREINLKLTAKELQKVEKDQLLIHAISAWDEVESSANKLAERLREWYSLSFPELEEKISNNEEYANVVCNKNGSEIEEIAEGELGIGMAFSKEDKKIVKKLASLILKHYQEEKELENYIQEMMQEIAPNISALVGEMIGARLIALAGSLKKLAILPASTIQVLGAENAFFRFLKTNKKPPKHGIIFQVPEIRSSPKKIRGNLARNLASKLAIAARLDYFEGEFKGQELREKFLKRLESLEE